MHFSCILNAALLSQFLQKHIRKMQSKYHKDRIKVNFLFFFLCLCVFFCTFAPKLAKTNFYVLHL